MLFIFSTQVLIRHLCQLRTVVFLHWCLICAVLLTNKLKFHQKCLKIELKNELFTATILVKYGAYQTLNLVADFVKINNKMCQRLLKVPIRHFYLLFTTSEEAGSYWGRWQSFLTLHTKTNFKLLVLFGFCCYVHR